MKIITENKNKKRRKRENLIEGEEEEHLFSFEKTCSGSLGQDRRS
jgi:hypothetical protein